MRTVEPGVTLRPAAGSVPMTPSFGTSSSVRCSSVPTANPAASSAACTCAGDAAAGNAGTGTGAGPDDTMRWTRPPRPIQLPGGGDWLTTVPAGWSAWRTSTETPTPASAARTEAVARERPARFGTETRPPESVAPTTATPASARARTTRPATTNGTVGPARPVRRGAARTGAYSIASVSSSDASWSNGTPGSYPICVGFWSSPTSCRPLNVSGPGGGSAAAASVNAAPIVAASG